MIKTFFTLLPLLLLSQNVLAQPPADSLAIFQKATSVTILVNEIGSGKLNHVMLAFVSPETDLATWQSPKHDVKLQCKRGQGSLPENSIYSCMFQFMLSSEITITASNMTAQLAVDEPQIVAPINLTFENKAHDLFKLELNATTLKSGSNKK